MNTKMTLEKRIISVILTVIIVLSMLPLSVFAAEDSEPGTADNPLLIGTAKEMREFGRRVNSGEKTLCVRLMADIDLRDEKWTPIGTNTNLYTGTFDGNGHTISGIQFAAAIDMGLFAYVGNGGTVQDLFVRADMENTLDNSGILVRANYGHILRCGVEITATTTINGNGAFGVIARMNQRSGVIEDCYASCLNSKGETAIQVQEGTNANTIAFAGISSTNMGTIKSCFFRGRLRYTIDEASHTASPSDYAIIATSYGGTVENSYCLNTYTYGWKDTSRTETVKQYYIYKDEKSGYGYGDIGIHSTDFVDSANPITTRSGSLTWTLNEGKADGPWRLHVSKSNPSDNYPTLCKTDSYVTKNEDESYSIVAPHFHEINGEQVEFKQVSSAEELLRINEGYVCLGNDSTVATFDGDKWNYRTVSGKDIILTDKWKPTGKVTLCLNGHKLFTTASVSSYDGEVGYGIELNKGAELTLLDCSKKSTGWIGGSETDSAIYGVTVNKGGALRIESGCINRCETGVIVDGGDFTMTGGEIKGSMHVAGVEYRSGSLTIGGSAKVVDNSKSGAQNILLIRKGKKTPTIAFDNPQNDAIFGICVGEYDGSQITAVTDGRIPVTGENCRQYYKNLFADRFICGGAPTDYDLYLNDDGAIEIGERKEHSHCLCGAEHKAGNCKDADGNPAGHLTEDETEFEPWDPYNNLDENGNPTLPTTGGSYYLTRSADIKSLSANSPTKWELNGSNDVKLCLNGHTITYHVTETTTDNSYRGWILVQDSSTLTITDCSDQGTVTCDNQATGKDWISAFWLTGGTLNLYGGTVKNFMRAVYIPTSGAFNMYGGTLTENSFEDGVGVYCRGGSAIFNLYGGSITNNKALWNAKYGNNIKGYSSSRMGGGVYADDGAKFTMYGGEISNNGQARGEADEPIWRGGGVYVAGDFTMTGGRITGNTAAVFTADKVGDDVNPSLGGGVYVSGNFTMTGGEISGNTLDGIAPNGKDRFISRGGGVCVGGNFTMKNATISGNTVTSGVAGGVYVGGTGSISDARIEKNEVSYSGNTSRYFGAGGGIFVNGKSSIENSFITENKVTDLKAGSSRNNNCCRGGGGIFLGNYGGGDNHSSIIGCTITGNTLEGSATATGGNKDQVGGGGVLVNIGTLTVENTTISGNTMTATDGSAMLGGGILCYKDVDGLTLKGNVTVKDNTSGGSANNLYFKNSDKTDFTATVGGALTGGKNSIGVTKVGADGSALTMPISIAKAAEGYTATQKDASCFFDDSGTYFAILTDDGSIQLKECLHENGYADGKCNICDAECKHPGVEEKGGKTLCATCKQQMIVKAEKDGKTTYSAKKTTKYGDYVYDETLDLLFKALENGSTVTLLADGLNAGAFVSSGKAVTLNMNGKSLTEENVGGIIVDTDENNPAHSKLIVTGSGSSTAPKDSKHPCAFRVRRGDNELVFDENFSGKYDTIRADGGTLTFNSQNAEIGTLVVQNAEITLKGGKFGTICGNIGTTVRAGSLLAEGYAFKNGSSYVRYDTEISQTSSLKNVTVAECDHTNLPGDFSGTACPYCNTALAATVTTENGRSSGYTEFKTALNAANDVKDSTLTLLTNVTDNLVVKANVTIRLSTNGRTVSGNVIVQKGANLTATGGIFSGKVNCVGKLNLTGSNLTGDLSVIGNAALDSCSVGKAVAVNKGGTLTVTAGGNIAKLTINKGANVTLSGGTFGRITIDGEKQLGDCLKSGYAFKDSNGIVDGRTAILFNVEVIEHLAHAYAWNTVTHELVCACGDVKETDTDEPLLYDNGNNLLDDGGSYYGDLIFTVKEKNLDKIVVDGTVTAAENGKYKIIADNKSHTIEASDLAGNTVSVVVNVYKIYNVNATDGIGYTVNAVKTANHGQNYIFTVTVKLGYTATDDYKVTVNGESLIGTLNGSSYTYTVEGSKVNDNLKISVAGVADITPPEVEMTIGTNKFKSLLNKLTFGLFFKETQTVTVTAGDAGSGVNTAAEYVFSQGELKQSDFAIISWGKLTLDKNGEGSFSIKQNLKAFVYVRVTDKAGNITVINSEGVVVYTDSEASTDSITFTRLSETDVTVTVDFKGNTVKSVFCDGIELDGTSYNVLYPSAGSGSTLGTVELKNVFLCTLAAGEHTIKVEYNPMGVAYTPADGSGSEAPATTEVKLTVVKAERTLTFDAPNAEYDGEAYDDLRIYDKPARTTVHYKEQGAEDSTYDTAAPKNAGSYTVKITVDADENYNAATFTKDFTVSPREVAIHSVKAADKTYDGTTTATIENIGTLSGKCDGDDLTIDAGNAKATFADENVGSRTVTFKGFALSGSAKGNYVLVAQPTSVTAEITRRELTVENLKVKDKLYDGTDKAEIDGTPKLNGVVEGDTLSLKNGTPTFKSIEAGNGISIIFTWFYLLGDANTLMNYTLTQPDGITANINAWSADNDDNRMYSVNSNGWINTDFVVTANNGYMLSFENKADGTWENVLSKSEEATDGSLIFYVKNPDGAISTAVTENYKIDKTAPEGKIEFNGRTAFQTVLNKISFGLLFNSEVNVKITANDARSGVKSVKYYKSEEILTEYDLKHLTDWADKNEIKIAAKDKDKFIIYARIEDNAGNTAYIGSDGATFDTVAPKLENGKLENGKTYYTTLTVTAKDDNLDKVTVNGNAVGNTFELAGNTDETYVIKATDKAGNITEYTVYMKPISALTESISEITTDNVKSDNGTAISKTAEKLENALIPKTYGTTDAETNLLQEEQKKCAELAERLEEVIAQREKVIDGVGGYSEKTVKSSDKANIEKLISEIDELLNGDNLTADERQELESLKKTAEALLEKIAAVKSETEKSEITDVRDITEENVKSEDKENLEKAKEELEKALEDHGDNLTEDEQKELEEQLENVKESLDAIDNAEKAKEEIDKLPSSEDVKLNDKEEVERIKKIVDGLTENEKAILGKETLNKLNALTEKINKLAADAAKPASPKTGDMRNIALWFALLFISGGVITGISVAGKRKKQQDR